MSNQTKGPRVLERQSLKAIRQAVAALLEADRALCTMPTADYDAVGMVPRVRLSDLLDSLRLLQKEHRRALRDRR